MIARLVAFVLTALVAAGLATTIVAEDGPAKLVFRFGRAYTGDGKVIDDAVLLVTDGVIRKIGTEGDFTPEDFAGAELVELPGQTVLPGLVASVAMLGDDSSAARSVTPGSLVIDGYDLFAEREAIVRGGVTTLGVSSKSSRLLSGRGCAVKAGGHRSNVARRILRRAVGYQVALGDLSRRPPSVYEPPVEASPDRPFEVLEIQAPVSRSGGFDELRRLLQAARVGRFGGSATSAASGAAFVPELAALQDLVAGRDFLQILATEARDVVRAVDLCDALKVSAVLVASPDVARAAPYLARHDIPVIVRGTFVPGELGGEDLSRLDGAAESEVVDGIAAVLSRAGVRVAIAAPNDESIPHLLDQALAAVAHGMTPAQALRAVTRTPAELLRIDDRVGSLAVGRDADIAVFSEDPFEARGHPVATYIAGELVSPRQKRVDDDVTVIRCARVLTATRGEIPGGVIVIKGGKIHAVGSTELLGAFSGAKRVIDARDETVIPGMIDCGSELGAHVDGADGGALGLVTPLGAVHVRRSASSRSPSGGGTAMHRIVDAIDPTDPQFDAVLESGITTVVVTPDDRAAIGGQITAIKIDGAARRRRDGKSVALEDIVVRDPIGFAMTTSGASVIAKAKTYHDQLTAYEKAREKKPKKPTPNEQYDALRPLFRGELLALIRVTTESQITGVLSGLVDKHGIKAILYGFPTLSAARARELASKNIGVLLGSRLSWSGEKGVVNLGEIASTEGLRFGVRSGVGSGARQLPLQIAWAVRSGWDETDALRAMTIHPARLLGLDKRIGSIEKGKDADLVFLRGRPLSMTSRVTRVMVDGRLVFEREVKQ